MSDRYDKQWYDSLKKPDFQPPAWVFAPVWSGLYFIMFFALALIIALPFNFVSLGAYFLFLAQFIVNLFWSPVFFEQHDLRKAFFLCALLTFLVFLTMTVFFYLSKIAALLFLPYLLWCCFATVLSFEIWELNSD